MRTSDDVTERAFVRMRNFAPRLGHREFPDFHLLGTAAIAEIEGKLRAWYGARFALCVSNATDALRAVALALDLQRTDFITTPIAWGGSIGEWMRLGNRIHFAPVDPLTLTLDPDGVRRMISKRTRAILAVDIFGNPADMTTLREIADAHGLWYVADASPSLGARRLGYPASSLADVWVVSFGTGKPVDGGDGAAILTNDRDIYEKLVWETQHPARQRIELGLSLDNEFASNSRMNPWTAMWLAATFDEQIERIHERQLRISRLLTCTAVSGLVTSALSAGDSVAPSFQRIVAAWQAGPRSHDLLALFRKHKALLTILPLPVRPLFDQPSFIAQYRRQAAGVLHQSLLGIDLSKYFVLQPTSNESE